MKINGVSENLPADQLPLLGLRVVECVTGPSAAIGRLLAELGADVIKVEPPEGAPDRYEGELVQGLGLDFLIGNVSKRSVTLDLTTDDGLEKFEALLKTTDILIQNFHEDKDLPGSLEAEVILERHPSLIILSASAFGVSSPCKEWQATDPVLQALSGELSISGAPGRDPLLPPGNLAYDNAMPQAVYAILVAYMDRLKTGQGDHLDFSILDGATQSLDPGYGIAGSAAQGIPLSKLPRGRPDAGFRYPILPCRDGFVRLCILAPRQWQGMFEWMGRPEEFSDPSL